MFGNYLKVAIRNSFRHKGYTAINVLGLAVGLACSFLILLYVLEETGYDRNHTDRSHIYRVITTENKFSIESPSSPYPMAPVLVQEYPEVEQAARIRRVSCEVSYEGSYTYERDCWSADPAIFSILTLPLVRGDASTALSEPSSVVLSETLAKKYFKQDDPVGKVLTVLCHGTEHQLRVTGVMEDTPRQTTFRANMIVSLDIAAAFLDQIFANAGISPRESWGTNSYGTYLLLAEGSDAAAVEARLEYLEEKYFEEWMDNTYSLQAMDDFYLHSDHLANCYTVRGDITHVYVFSIIALAVLTIACLNFIILSTARAASRSLEIGMRKIVGADKSDLIWQILMESVFMSMLALPLAVVLVEVGLPFVNELFRTELTASYVDNWVFTLAALGVTLVASSCSGLYMGVYLSAFRPIDALRNRSAVGESRITFRRVLVVIQLVIFVSLVFGSGVIYKQIYYATNQDLGFDRDNLFLIGLPDSETYDRIELLKAEIESHPGVMASSGTSVLPPTDSWSKTTLPAAFDSTVTIAVESILADFDYVGTLGLEILEGRDLSQDIDGAGSVSVLLNERAVKDLGIEDPIGYDLRGRTVVGVVKDYHIHSFRQQIHPLMIGIGADYFEGILVRLDPQGVAATVESLEETWTQFYPDEPFNYGFFDDELETLYLAETRFGNIVGCFTLMTIFVACLGLVGLSSFMAERRTKELGVRKVLGASETGLVAMLSRESAGLCLIASLIAWPVGHFAMSGWLDTFAYSTEIGFVVPLSSALLALLITIATVSFQAYRTARTNPVEALRCE